MTANPLQEAPNWMMKPATTAKCHTTSTAPSALAFLASPQTPGLPLAPLNLLLHNIDTMMYYFDNDLYYNCAPISLPGDCKDMAKSWYASPYSSWELMSAPHTLSTQSGGRMTMHN